MTAIWSLNEIEALARKAARGAGYDWGASEDVGRAVRWLLTWGLPGADALVMACRPDVVSAPESCSLTQGCALSDGLVSGFVERDIAAPLLVLPFVAWCAERTKSPHCLRWEGVTFAVSSTGELTVSGDNYLAKRAIITVERDIPEGLAAPMTHHRAEVSCATYVALTELAGKTYAPATEASRESGAGAGLTDND